MEHIIHYTTMPLYEIKRPIVAPGKTVYLEQMANDIFYCMGTDYYFFYSGY